jgi:hypothetical protein
MTQKQDNISETKLVLKTTKNHNTNLQCTDCVFHFFPNYYHKKSVANLLSPAERSK